MFERLRRILCAGNPFVTFTIACIHCDHTDKVDAPNIRVQTVDGSPDTYLTVRCANCDRVTPTKVTHEVADKALNGGARLVQFKEAPPIRERDIARMMANIDDEYDALCEAWC